MKLILEAIKSLIRKVENLAKVNAAELGKVSKRLSGVSDTANNALKAAKKAQSMADTAKANAATAQTAANTAKSAADKAQQTADNVQANLGKRVRLVDCMSKVVYFDTIEGMAVGETITAEYQGRLINISYDDAIYRFALKVNVKREDGIIVNGDYYPLLPSTGYNTAVGFINLFISSGKTVPALVSVKGAWSNEEVSTVSITRIF